MTTPRFIPQLDTTSPGGTRFGTSYLNKWASCPRNFFNTYLRPVAEGDQLGTGIAPLTVSANLNRGSVFHVGLEHYYLSGCRDGEDTGEYDIHLAIDMAKAFHNTLTDRWRTSDKADEEWEKCQSWLLHYADAVGPTSVSPDYPDIYILHDGNGEPLIERTFELELSPGYIFTSKPDALISYNGYLNAMDHKTSAPSWIGRRLQHSETDTQFDGEILSLKTLFPDEPFRGCVVNVVKKGSPGGTTQMVTRTTTTRTDHELNSFRTDVTHILQEIDEAHEGWKREIERGLLDPHAVTDHYFPQRGRRTQACYAFADRCPFLDLCKTVEHEAATLTQFRMRSVEETTAQRENVKEWS